MKWFNTVLLFASIFTGGLQAQSCGFISDSAGVISNPSVVEQGASTLIDRGSADVHVVTVDNLSRYGSRLADVELNYLSQCPQWTDGRGHPKANLFVIMVAPKARLKNVFFGGAFTSVFPTVDKANQPYTAAVPYFKQGDYSTGIASALRDYGNAVVAFHDQAIHPVQNTTTVTQQATDLKPVASFFKWLLFVAFLVLLAVGVYYFFRKRKQDKEELSEAQQDAQAARNAATLKYRSLDKNSSEYADISAQYQDLSNSVKYDPNSAGLSLAEYKNIASAWSGLRHSMDSVNPSAKQSDYPAQGRGGYTYPVAHKTQKHTSAKRTSVPVSPTPVTTVHNTYVDNSGGSGSDLLTGMLIGEELNSNRRNNDYNRPYSAPSYDPPSRSSSDDSSSSFGSGSDSSWSSSSDSSSFSSSSDSSWSDSSSSSDFGGSGSDSSW